MSHFHLPLLMLYWVILLCISIVVLQVDIVAEVYVFLKAVLAMLLLIYIYRLFMYHYLFHEKISL